MKRLPSVRGRAMPLVLACIAGAAGWPAASLAQVTQPSVAAPAVPSDTRRLTDQERQAILDGNTVETAAAARGDLPGSALADRRVHGEVGIMIGTGGARGIYGVADVPLGDRAGATISFQDSRLHYRR